MMNLSGKKIWFDVEEPKTGVMFKSLIQMFQNTGVKLLITARDYDSTFQILDDLKLNYLKIGRHGGERLEEKLRSSKSVEECCVISKTYDDNTFELYAFIVSSKDCKLKEKKLLHQLNKILNKEEKLKSVIFIESMPRLPSGKVDKISLNKILENLS